MEKTMTLPETILQFGTGRFLRAFVDRFVQRANDEGQAVGRVVAVQSTGNDRAELLGTKGKGYHVLVRGYEDGQLVERMDEVKSVSRGLVAATEWPMVLEVARSPQLKYLVSNTTESGYQLDPADTLHSAPPASFPAKLARVLWERYQASQSPLVILPCELIERNAERLRDLVRQQILAWQLPVTFEPWVSGECVWLCNLVDCMVTRAPADHPLTKKDPLLIHAEPYALWAIEKPPVRRASESGILSVGGRFLDHPVKLFDHPAIQLVDDLTPYYLRKVRMLNGLHTAMVGKYLTSGWKTVQELLADKEAAKWVRGLLYEEIVPTIAYRIDGVAEFAEQTLDRLRNPFLAHLLSDIAANHEDKVRVRLQPTFEEYQKLFGKAPPRLKEAMGKK
jgi:tagaturonate reductase